MIKELNELIWLVSRGVDRAEEHLAFLCKNKPEVISLYRAVRNGNFRTDEEAIVGTGIGGRTSYKKYGRILIGHLHQLVFFLSSPGDAYTQRRNEGFKTMSIMRLLEFNSCKHSARQIALDLLDNGLKNDRPEWVVDATRSLMGATSYAHSNLKDFEQYAALFQEYKTYLDREQMANLYFDEKCVHYVHKKGYRPEVVEQLKYHIEELHPLAFKIPSIMFNLCYSLIAFDCHFLAGHYQQAISVLEKAIEYFQSRRYDTSHHQHVLFYRKVLCFKELGQYEKGHQAIQECLRLSTEGTVNWYATLEIHFYLCMHTERYSEALEVYKAATCHKRFVGLNEATQEVWNIFGAYIFLAYKLTCRDLPELHFRAAKFLNQVPIFSRDKNGLNVAILIAHAVLQLIEGKQDNIWERVWTLEKYRERYLKNGDTERSRCFVKILVAMARADFRREQYESKIAVLLERLQAMTGDTSKQTYEMEIIPYLKLYELARDFCSPRNRRKQVE